MGNAGLLGPLSWAALQSWGDFSPLWRQLRGCARELSCRAAYFLTKALTIATSGWNTRQIAQTPHLLMLELCIMHTRGRFWKWKLRGLNSILEKPLDVSGTTSLTCIYPKLLVTVYRSYYTKIYVFKHKNLIYGGETLKLWEAWKHQTTQRKSRYPFSLSHLFKLLLAIS